MNKRAALEQLGDITFGRTDSDLFYIIFIGPSVEMKDGPIARSVCGFAETEDEVIDNVYEEMTNGTVLLDGLRPTRRTVRWTGKRWKDVL